jgi:hypothetical protein
MRISLAKAHHIQKHDFEKLPTSFSLQIKAVFVRLRERECVCVCVREIERDR